MYILTLETSTKNFSLALSKDAKVLKFSNKKTDKILESSMIGSIEKLLKSCELSFKKVDALVVGLGPGSFTSLRVGLSTVKAVALATDKKVVGICSLDAVASGAPQSGTDQICVIMDARRGKVYAAIYDVGAGLTPAQNIRKTEYLLTTIEDVLTKIQGTALFVGDGIPLYKEIIEEACQASFAPEKFWYPQAKELAKLGAVRLNAKNYDDAATLIPIYLYPEDCQVHRR